MFMHVRKDKLYRERRNLSYLRNEEYHKLYRFTKENVEFLAKEFFEESYEARGGALNSFQKIELTLRYLADPGFQRSVGYEMGVTQSTLSKTLQSTLPTNASKAAKWITFPSSDEEVKQTKEDIFVSHKFPMCVGAIDCTHARIQKPKGRFGDEFINRKFFPSINVQATCNNQYIFTSVDCGWPGSVHDNRIFKNSDIYTVITRAIFCDLKFRKS